MNEEFLKLRRMLAILVLVGIACYFGYVELAFLAGRDATGTVTKVTDVTQRRHTYREVEFTFVESNGTARTGKDNISTSWVPPASGTIVVRYTSGSARIAGNVNWIAVVVCVVVVCLLLFYGVRIWLQMRAEIRMYDDTKPRKRKKRRRSDDD